MERTRGGFITREINRFTNPLDGVLFRNAEHRLQHLRNEVRVLVSVQMRGTNPSFEYGFKLLTEMRQRIDTVPGKSLNKRRNILRQIRPLHQNQVATHVKRRRTFGQLHCVPDSRPGGHESSGGEDAIAMARQNSFVYVSREAKIIGIYNQPALHT